ALIAYPFLIEPRLGVIAQTRLWTVGYLCLGVFLLFTGAAVRGAQARQRAASINDRAYSYRERFFWLAAAFVPSALMLAVTNHIAENIGSMPFLWIVPLALYLLTFIFAF